MVPEEHAVPAGLLGVDGELDDGAGVGHERRDADQEARCVHLLNLARSADTRGAIPGGSGRKTWRVGGQGRSTGALSMSRVVPTCAATSSRAGPCSGPGTSIGSVSAR